jgi:hypothetical protein
MFANASTGTNPMEKIMQLQALGGGDAMGMSQQQMMPPTPLPGTPPGGQPPGIPGMPQHNNTRDMMKMMLLSQLFNNMRTGDGGAGDQIKGSLASALPLIMMGLQDYRAKKQQKNPGQPQTPVPQQPNNVTAPGDNSGVLFDSSAIDNVARMGRGGFIS